MSIAARIEAIEERIAQACLRSGRKREEITLMGVTKFVPVEAVAEAWEAGLRCFGESRVQEASVKFGEGAAKRGELHLIGALQRNKVKTAVSLFDCIQSVDRESLVAELAKHTAGRGEPLSVLLEFRTGEDSKSGFADTDALFRAAELILACPSLRPRGLMTIAPNTGDEKVLRSAFRRVVQIQQELERRFPDGDHGWDCLSMGMSGDFEIAVEEGSTMLRIGTSLFGERN
jgi:pyridoxal phosphate enzyme (YggS family)